MRLARFSYGDGQPSYGLVLDAAKAKPGEHGTANGTTQDGQEQLIVAELAGHPISEGGAKLTGASYPLEEVRLLTPVVGSSKIVCVGRNYADHIAELGNQRPEEPIIFLKPSTAVCGPGDPIRRPAVSERVDYEGELAVVIGRISQDVPAERAAEVIYGYTCANDVTARDLQAKDGQWTRAKGFDTFCPLGPWVETDIDPADLELTTTLNDQVRQRSRTSLLLHGVPALIAFVTQVMTLLPGDVLLTGTPAGVGPMVKGDEVSVTIEGIGTLANPVVDRD